MSHPALATAAPADPPACLAPAPLLTTKARGNPDLHLAPRCGAHARAGCPCRAPAIHGKQRCRMHGGRSTGPRTAAGMASLRVAHTIHGAYSAETRALNRHSLTELRRGRVGHAAARCLDRLPPDLATRLMQMPPELLPLPWPTGGLTPAQDRAVLRAETDALAPWWVAIAQAGLASRAGKARRPVVVDRPAASAEVHAPVLHHGVPAPARDAAGSTHPNGAAKPLAPELSPGTGNSALPASPAAHIAPTQQPAKPCTRTRPGGVRRHLTHPTQPRSAPALEEPATARALGPCRVLPPMTSGAAASSACQARR